MVVMDNLDLAAWKVLATTAKTTEKLLRVKT